MRLINDEDKKKWFNERIDKGFSFTYKKCKNGLNNCVICNETKEVFYLQFDGETIYKHTSKRLWQLLDDIDTLSDIIKPSDLDGYIKFYELSMKKAKERFNFLTSDGYDLFINKELK